MVVLNLVLAVALMARLMLHARSSLARRAIGNTIRHYTAMREAWRHNSRKPVRRGERIFLDWRIR